MEGVGYLSPRILLGQHILSNRHIACSLKSFVIGTEKELFASRFIPGHDLILPARRAL